MICKFHVGQRVVCVRDDWDQRLRTQCPGARTPVAGARYVVREIAAYGDDVGIALREIVNHKYDLLEGRHEILFWHQAFRPLDERDVDISAFKEILALHPTTPRRLERVR